MSSDISPMHLFTLMSSHHAISSYTNTCYMKIYVMHKQMLHKYTSLQCLAIHYVIPCYTESCYTCKPMLCILHAIHATNSMLICMPCHTITLFYTTQTHACSKYNMLHIMPHHVIHKLIRHVNSRYIQINRAIESQNILTFSCNMFSPRAM